MRMYDLIWKKREGHELSAEEINFIVQGYTRGEIPDYQVAAWLMAVYFRGLSTAETTALTRAMVESGEQIRLAGFPGPVVDKHSTGGVGDKTTLVLIPLVAAAGVPVAKMSGRGLGHTGGTIDKLESIPGFRVELNREEFLRQVQTVGAAVVAQTADLVPADKKLYALRDATATVESIPLIAASIMSKKIAAGADAIVLDVKVGSGAFMRTREQAKELAQVMTKIGRETGRRTVAVLTAMEQPLGYAVGNALEVAEAVATLKGQGPADLRELVLILGSYMLVLGGKAENPEVARRKLEECLASGAAAAKLTAMIAAQGGAAEVVEEPAKVLPRAAFRREVTAARAGVVAALDARSIGLVAMKLGAGRSRKEDRIDPAAGILLRKKVGDRVEAGEPLAELHSNSEHLLTAALAEVADAFIIADTAPIPLPLCLGVIE